MFTGIVEELGEVVATGPGRLTVRGSLVTSGAQHGDSIAVNGVCLTVAELTADRFAADLLPETLRVTALGGLRPGDPVNLERAATATTRLGGHLVQGHCDGVGTIVERRPGADWDEVRVSLPDGMSRYLVPKGSITVDGVSLTVVSVDDDWFEVSLIPTTLAVTTLGRKRPGDPVNLEVDVIAKYVEKFVTGVRP